MFNFVNGNPFGQKIESAVSTGQENKRQQQNQDKDEERKYLEDDDNDEVDIAQRPVLTEDDIKYLLNEYIAKLKSEHENEPKVLQKLDKFMAKFNIQKFMKSNPDMTVSDFNMVMYNETAELLNLSPHTAMLVEHMILSHHGTPEFGSPKAPMFPEAEVLSDLDLLDSRLYEMFSTLEGIQHHGFSERQWALDNRQLYRHAFGTNDPEA